MFDYNYNYN